MTSPALGASSPEASSRNPGARAGLTWAQAPQNPLLGSSYVPCPAQEARKLLCPLGLVGAQSSERAPTKASDSMTSVATLEEKTEVQGGSRSKVSGGIW